jgi:hypothetical protein
MMLFNSLDYEALNFETQDEWKMAYFKSQKELRNNTKQISHNSQTIQP